MPQDGAPASASFKVIPTDAALSDRIGGQTPHLLFGGDAVISTTRGKQELKDATGAAAVDLESGVVATLAAARGLPFAVLRAVCDPAERSLPAAALVALDAEGRIRPWPLVQSLLRDPRQVIGLLRLAADAAAARRSLLGRVKQIGVLAGPSGEKQLPAA
jgi:adenosylhomocysteine nucleosidase